MMDLIEVARLEERRLVAALRDVAPESMDLAGGVAGRGEPGNWTNCAMGIGLAGDVSAADVARLVEWHGAARAEPRAELTPFVSAATLRAFEEAGFGLRAYETVLFRELGAPERDGAVETPSPRPEGLAVSVVDRWDGPALREAVGVGMSGFYPEGVSPSDGDLAIGLRAAGLARVTTLAARLDGRVVGAGWVEVFGEVAALFGVSVLPAFRRRGVQQALLAERLVAAARAGCRVATIGSRPGAATERNVRRMGFGVAYVKGVVARSGPGLKAVST